MATQIGAHYLLEGLVELGMEYLFANLGTDHVSIVEELARWRKEGRADLQVVICPHENVAVHMAGGYAAVTGRGQPVLVHVDVGTANSGNALHNLFHIIWGILGIVTYRSFSGARTFARATAIVYGLLNVVGTIAVLKFFRYGSLGE